MKYIRDIENLSGKKVLMRLDFNVPVKNGIVMDDFRIRHILPTISYLREKGAKLILMSHIENGVGVAGDNPSLAPVVKHLKKLGVDCAFVTDYSKIPLADIVLLENLRMNPGEKKNDPVFAQSLAKLGDIYINEAFAVSHRAHASVSAITKFIPSYAGMLFEKEIEHLSSAFHPDHPFLFILGGAKFETKMPLIEKFMKIADKVFVGGALANNFFKEEGKEIGKSIVSPDNFKLARYFDDPKLMLPVDVVAGNAKDVIKRLEKVGPNESILDAGPETLAMLEKTILASKYVLWNGPLGAYEQGYMQPTLDLAQMIARSTKHGVKSILGGGDTLAAIAHLNIEDQFTFVSSGGGAMLDFLATGTLPAIEALNARS